MTQEKPGRMETEKNEPSLSLLTAEERRRVEEICSIYYLHGEDSLRLNIAHVEDLGTRRDERTFTPTVVYNAKHNLHAGTGRRAEAYDAMIHVFPISDGRDEEQVLREVEDVVSAKRLEEMLDIQATRRNLEQADRLAATISTMSIYSSSHPRRVTGPDGGPDWWLGGFVAETRERFICVPGFGCGRHLQQSPACADIPRTRTWLDPWEPKWQHGEEARDAIINDPDVLRSYAIHEREIEDVIVPDIAKSRSIISVHAAEHPALPLNRGWIRGLEAGKPDFDIDPNKLDAKKTIHYLEGKGLVLNDAQKAVAYVADGLDVIDPYEVAALGRPENHHRLDETIAAWADLAETARHENVRGRAKETLRDTLEDHGWSMHIILGEKWHQHPAWIEGWLDKNNGRGFIFTTVDGDIVAHREKIETYLAAIDYVKERQRIEATPEGWWTDEAISREAGRMAMVGLEHEADALSRCLDEGRRIFGSLEEARGHGYVTEVHDVGRSNVGRVVAAPDRDSMGLVVGRHEVEKMVADQEKRLALLERAGTISAQERLERVKSMGEEQAQQIRRRMVERNGKGRGR